MTSKPPSQPPIASFSSLIDPFTQLTFHLIRFFAAWTVVRYVCAAVYFWPYAVVQLFTVLPTVLVRLPLLVFPPWLIARTDAANARRARLAGEQLRGTFEFDKTERLEGEVLPPYDKWQEPYVEYISVCGLDVCYIHRLPSPPAPPSGKVVVLVHGNPSWSWMWRSTIPFLASQGHEVLALDFSGHGRSDKPINPAQLTFELHMRTLHELLSLPFLANKETMIAAHDWGGAITLLTLAHPALPSPLTSPPSLFLLNTFFPPRTTPLLLNGSDISYNGYALYLLWYLSTGILGPLLPESFVMRFMSPTISAVNVSGYGAPYLNRRHKAGVGVFAHMIPWMVDGVYKARKGWVWRLVEGLVPESWMDNFHKQARLREMDLQLRNVYSSPKTSPTNKHKIVFGRDDPLLADFKDILTHTLEKGSESKGSVWVKRAGHYPLEDKSADLNGLLAEFVDEEGWRKRGMGSRRGIRELNQRETGIRGARRRIDNDGERVG
ncbi:alpha/beta-hydrolase [Saitoella complicata NRRL Y-17804]|nr:alpha/beta-hydrolase [Saitoella complicata NRRL Y-17804]ODQ55508.1 alpha/beta-hydrolase [Saitoella complicata NRRL Y-17804]